MYGGSEYQYPVVINQTNKVASFINIEDMLFEVGYYLLLYHFSKL